MAQPEAPTRCLHRAKEIYLLVAGFPALPVRRERERSVEATGSPRRCNECVIPGARMIDASVLPPVMPAQAGIHDFRCCNKDKSWIPAFAGMTGGSGPYVNV